MTLFPRKIFKEYTKNTSFRGHLKNIGLIIGAVLPFVLIGLPFIGHPGGKLIVIGPILGGFLVFCWRYILGVPLPQDFKEAVKS